MGPWEESGQEWNQHMTETEPRESQRIYTCHLPTSPGTHILSHCRSSISSHVGLSKLTSDLILISEILNGKKRKGDSDVHSCVKGTHIAVPIAWLTIEAKTPQSPTEVFSSFPMTPIPTNHNKAVHLEGWWSSVVSLCPESVALHTIRKEKEEGEGRGRDFISLILPRV